MYTALVLDDIYRDNLIKRFPAPQGWDVIAHHMTLHMGKAVDGIGYMALGHVFFGKVIAVASDDKVMAVEVETNCPSANKIKHITIAVNRAAGGKPFHSNNLTNWTPFKGDVEIYGVVKECK